jgi:hypothetical protein
VSAVVTYVKNDSLVASRAASSASRQGTSTSNRAKLRCFGRSPCKPYRAGRSRALAEPGDFIDVPRNAPDYRLKIDGLHRDSPSDSRPAWVVTDGNYVSARWPGDAFTFAKAFATVLARTEARVPESVPADPATS